MTYRPATQEDVSRVCKNLRQEDINEAYALYGVHPGLFVPLHWLKDETWALVGRSGKAEAIAGTYPWGDGQTGQIWMISTPGLYDNKLEFLRYSAQFIEMCHERYPILHNYIDARQKTHLEWLQWCGFSAIAYKATWGVAGLPFYEMMKVAGGDYPAKQPLKRKEK